MKKTLLAAALLAATSYATAASNVTLYGVLDAGVTVSKLHGDSTKVQMSNGNWAIAGVSKVLMTLETAIPFSSNWNKVSN